MTAAPPVPAQPRTYAGQRYDHIGTEPYTRSDGTVTELLRWQSHYAECGAAFIFRTPARAKRFVPNRRCHEHRRPGVPVRAVAA
jgi:hypothetical protein